MSVNGIKKLLPALRIKIKPKKINLPVEPTTKRLDRIANGLTELIKKERIQMNYQRGHDVQPYAERVSFIVDFQYIWK